MVNQIGVVFILFIVLAGCISAEYTPNLVIAAFCNGDADILPFWLEYHAALLGGAQNILIMDKSEGIDAVFDVLKPWNKKGLKVELKSGQLNFRVRVDLALQSIATNFPKADLALVLNVDEFLVSFQGGFPVLGKVPFQASLQSFWNSNQECAGIDEFAYCCNKDAKTDTVESVDTFRITNPNSDQRSIMYKVPSISKYESLECPDKVTFGFLKYPTRSPTNLISSALADSQFYGTIKQEITLKNLKDHELYLFNLTTFANYPGRNKIMQLLIYAMHGYDGVSIPCRLSDHFIGNMTTIVNSVRV